MSTASSHRVGERVKYGNSVNHVYCYKQSIVSAIIENCGLDASIHGYYVLK